MKQVVYPILLIGFLIYAIIMLGKGIRDIVKNNKEMYKEATQKQDSLAKRRYFYMSYKISNDKGDSSQTGEITSQTDSFPSYGGLRNYIRKDDSLMKKWKYFNIVFFYEFKNEHDFKIFDRDFNDTTVNDAWKIITNDPTTVIGNP